MTTLSSITLTSSLASTSSSNTVNSLASTSSAATQEPGNDAASSIVTIPSTKGETLSVYTPQGALDGSGLTTISWAQSNSDVVSMVMAQDYTANTIAGQFSNLGSALLDRFGTTGSDFSQSVTVGLAGAAGSTASVGGLVTSVAQPHTDIKLTVQTASGVAVDIEMDSENGTLGVSVKSSGPLTDADRNALASLANGFQQAVDGLSAFPPQLDLSGLTQYNSSVLSSVNLQFNVTGALLINKSVSFSENSSARSVSLTDATGTMNLSVNTSASALLGSGGQRNQAIASYLHQFDDANAEGHGNAQMMALFKDAFTQLNSAPAGTDGTSWLAQSEQSMLTGLSDFTGSISDRSDVIGEPGSFSYQVSQSTTTTGDSQSGTISQTQQSLLKADYRVAQPSSSQNYDDVQIEDDASSTVKLATEHGILTQASLSQSSSDSTRNSEYVKGKLISDVITPTNTSTSKDLLAMLTPLIQDGQAAQDSGTWQQTLSTIHGMILLNASAS